MLILKFWAILKWPWPIITTTLLRVRSVKQGLLKQCLRSWFDHKLITTTRGTAFQGTDDVSDISEAALNSLIEQLLLRVEDKDGQIWYRLVNDGFIPAILRANLDWWVEQDIKQAQISQQDVEQLGDVNTALAQFYEQVLATVLQNTDTSEIALRNWFDQQLITEAGTRSTIYCGPQETGGLANQVVTALEDQFLLRAEARAGGIWYELVHDRFIDPIQQANQAWFARQSPPHSGGPKMG